MKNFRRTFILMMMLTLTAVALSAQTTGKEARKAKREARREARKLEQAIMDSLKMASYLDEEVNIGYGTVKRRHLSSSVSKVTVDDDAIGSCSNIAEYLMGKVPGLTVFQEGDGYRYQIRGANSFYGSTEPLFLVDGIETDNIDHINPLEVRSVEVLKDGSASIYGTRGANGVIMITTKR